VTFFIPGIYFLFWNIEDIFPDKLSLNGEKEKLSTSGKVGMIFLYF
jgi:hypothetical protein